MELAVAVIGLIVAVIGVPKAIFELRKAYLERHKSSGKEAEPVNISNNKGVVLTNSTIGGNVSTNTDSGNVTIHGDVIVGESREVDAPADTLPDDNIILKDTYTSLFAEKGEVHSERITIRNLGGGRVEGEVYLDNTHVYSLTGTFKNRILTGEFTSTGKYNDERGTINLKLISEDILSGFCSFSKTSMSFDDQIRMSPYVWVAGTNSQLLCGTYDFCTACHNEGRKCCCASADIDMPVLLRNEAQRLQSKNPRQQRMRDFSHNIGNTPIRQVNSIQNGATGVHCHFYNPHENCCKIYDVRPIDCRLFPFDIKLDPNTNEYWVGYYNDLCERQLPSIETMKQYAHMLRPLLFLLFPYANTINQEDVCKHLSKANFERLYRLEQFIF